MSDSTRETLGRFSIDPNGTPEEIIRQLPLVYNAAAQAKLEERKRPADEPVIVTESTQ